MTSGTAQTMTARRPEDVLAAVPLVLGFVPEDSVVMLAWGAEEQFHARLDLPLSTADRRAAAVALLTPVLRHGVRRVLFVLYTGDRRAARSCARLLVRRFTARGVGVLAVLRSDRGRWFDVPVGGEAEGPGTPYDASGHLFTAEAVARGHVVRPSRADLAASVAADEEAAAAVAAVLARLAGGPPSEPAAVVWAMDRLVPEERAPAAETAAGLLLALGDATVRDAVLGPVDRVRAARLLAPWSGLVRAAPRQVLAPAASVLAFLAWLAGDGALAWCALDRAAEGDPPCPLADLVADALVQALPPARWEERSGEGPARTVLSAPGQIP